MKKNTLYIVQEGELKCSCVDLLSRQIVCCWKYSHTKTLLQKLDKIVRLAPLEVFSCNPSLDLTFHWTHDKEEQSEYLIVVSKRDHCSRCVLF